MLSASCPLLEAVVRRRLLADDHGRVLDRHEVTGLRADRGRTVRGVAVRLLDGAATIDLAADLVVDAAGRGSCASAWAQALGVHPPQETAVDPDIAYASQVFRVPDGFVEDWHAVMLTSAPPSMARTGYLFPIEHDSGWSV